jgi:hypothetical protein
MKTSRLMKVSEDLGVIISIEKNESLDGFFTFAIQTMDDQRHINNKLQLTMTEEKCVELFEQLERLKCSM